MPRPFDSAQLNLQLFDLSRESVLREAPAWFVLEFNSETFTDLIEMVSGERNSSFRMVLGYWDIASAVRSVSAEPESANTWRLSSWHLLMQKGY